MDSRIRNLLGAGCVLLAAATAHAAAQDPVIVHGRYLLGIGTLFLAIVLVFYLGRKLAGVFSAEKKRESAHARSQIDFMANTFHELVQKLKEKERELQELRERAENRAGDIESYNENILQSVPSGVVSFDRSSRITHMNTSAERILGMSREEALKKTPEDLFGERIAGLISSKDFLDRGEVPYESSAKKRMWLGMNISPLRDRSGDIIGKILVFTDLTDLKALEAQSRLRENLASLGEMSAGIAHELRNPMAVIAGHTKLLSRKVSEDLRESVESIEKEIQMMDRIIRDFMSFARPVVINTTEVDLQGLIREVADAVTSGLDAISVSLEADACRISADETLIRQVLTNLFRNAVDSMAEGGTLSVSAERMDGTVVLAVRDTGHGISDDIRKKIFLPFYTTKEHGTGLGLAIVHKIVTAHGGSIAFESSPEGTVFRLTLPCA